MSCSGDCNQGRKACPTPQACFLADDELESVGDNFLTVEAVMLACALALFLFGIVKWN